MPSAKPFLHEYSPTLILLKKRKKLMTKYTPGNILSMVVGGAAREGKEAAVATAVSAYRQIAELLESKPEAEAAPATPAERFADMHAADPRTKRGKLG